MSHLPSIGVLFGSCLICKTCLSASQYHTFANDHNASLLYGPLRCIYCTTKMSYNIYKISELGAPRNHQAIFIETNEDDGGGDWMHVHGNIQNGMEFECRKSRRPELSDTFVDKELIGSVVNADHPRVEQICRTIDVPKKQFEGPKRLYPNEPLRRCQEWTREAIDRLEAEGVLKK